LDVYFGFKALADLHEELPLRFRIALQDHLYEISSGYHHECPLPNFSPMRHLPSLFVILLSAATATLAVLFVQAQREYAELEAHSASLRNDIEQQVVFMQGQTEALRREMLLEIQEEIHNQGKHDNAGLADTLEMLGEGTAYLLAQTPLDEDVDTRDCGPGFCLFHLS